MEESSTYRAILRRGVQKGRKQGIEVGAIKQARDAILLFGTRRLGSPSKAIESRLAACKSLAVLQDAMSRLDLVSSWDEVLPD